MFACLSIVLTAALWYDATHYTKVFQWYEDLALYKQGVLVAMATMLMVALGVQAKVPQNSECLTLMLGAVMIMMVMVVKRIDEESATIFHVMGQERKKIQELIHGSQQQIFAETNMMMKGVNTLKSAVNEDFKKMSSFVADSNRFTYQKMDDIPEERNYRITKVIDRLIRIEYKQERQEARALHLEKRLKQRKRKRTPSMSSEAKREILQKRQDRREAPGTPTESEVMSMLESPAPPELFPEGDGRIAPHEEENSALEEDESQPEDTTRKVTGMSQEQWNGSSVKERKYFLLTVTWEAACVYGDEEQMGELAQQMQSLADEINIEAVARRSGASSSHLMCKWSDMNHRMLRSVNLRNLLDYDSCPTSAP